MSAIARLSWTAIDCPAMGGSFADGPPGTDSERLGCWAPRDLNILQPSGLVGIRCCADE